MIDLTTHSSLLRLLHGWYRIRHWLRRRNPLNGQVEADRGAFHERLWREAAAQVGATIHPLGYGFYEIRRGNTSTRVRGNWTPLDHHVTSFLTDTKPLVYRLMAGSDLPTPRHIIFNLKSMGSAVAFLKSGSAECVIKPAAGTQAGQGITTGITTPNQLARAAVYASLFDSEILIEEQVRGDNYRLLYLDGQLLDAVLRRPPAVTGDDKTNIRGLLQRTNADRLKLGSSRCSQILTIDLDMKQTLARQGLSLSSVPAAGERVALKTVINQNAAEDNVTATDSICRSVIRDGARAAGIAGSRLAGVDIVTPNPGIPLAEAGGVILEVNTPPGFHHHYNKADGSCPVAVRVLQTLLGVVDTTGNAVDLVSFAKGSP
jgi:cyanophycin synthetase